MAKQNTDRRNQMAWARSNARLLLGDRGFEREGETVSALMHLGGQDRNRRDVEIRRSSGPCNLERSTLEPAWAIVKECPNLNYGTPTEKRRPTELPEAPGTDEGAKKPHGFGHFGIWALKWCKQLLDRDGPSNRGDYVRVDCKKGTDELR